MADQSQASDVSWPLLLRQLWVTAVGWAAALALVAAVDIYTRASRLAESKAHPKVYSVKRASEARASRGSDWHQELYRTFHPSRSRLGVAIEVAAVILGLAQWILYLYLTYKQEWNTAATVLTITFTAFFIARLVIRVSVVESGRRVPWMLHMDRGCDVWASLSSLITFAPYARTFWNFTFLRIVNMYFAVVELENWYEMVLVDRLWRFVSKMILLVTAFLAVMAAVVSTLETAGNPPGWDSIVNPRGGFTSFNALYWSLITTTTVGYGDIAPITVLGRLATMIFLIGGIVIIGFFTSRLLELLAGEKLGRGAFFNPSRKSSVLVVGEVRDETLKNVLHELYHPEHVGARTSLATVVMVDKHAHSAEMTQYLRAHTLFSNTVTYLVGSVFEAADLRRAGADKPECQAVLCMQQVHGEDDTANLLRVLAIRRRLPVLPIYTMLANSDNIPFLRAAGVHEEGILPMDTIKQGIMAANIVTPGVATLLINMFSVDVGVQEVASEPARRKSSRLLARGASKLHLHHLPATAPPTEQWTERDGAQTAPSRAPDMHYDLSTATRRFAAKLLECLAVRSLCARGPHAKHIHWQAEYGAGLGQEVYEVKCPAWLVGKQLLDAVIIIFCSKLIRHATRADDPSAPYPATVRAEHATAELQPQTETLGQLADAALNTLQEGPVLIAVSHLSTDSGELHFLSDLRSHRTLSQEDNLFIMARQLSELGHDIVAAGKRIIESHPTLVSAVLTGTPTRTESGACSPTGGSEKHHRFQQTLTMVGAISPRAGMDAGRPTHLEVGSPGTSSPDLSTLSHPHAVAGGFILSDLPAQHQGHPMVERPLEGVKEAGKAVSSSRPLRKLTSSSTPAGIVFSDIHEESPKPTRSSSLPVQREATRSKPTRTAPGTGNKAERGSEFSPPSDLTGHIVIMTTGGVSGLAGLPHLVYPLRFLTKRPVVVVTNADEQQWAAFVQQLKDRRFYATPASNEPLGCASASMPSVVGNGSTSNRNMGRRSRHEHSPPYVTAPLYYVQGSPLQGTALVQARLMHARRCVILTSTAHPSDQSSLTNTTHRGTLNDNAMSTYPLEIIMTDAAAILSTLIIENSLIGVAPALLYGTCTEVTRDGSLGLLTPAWHLSNAGTVGSPRMPQPMSKANLVNTFISEAASQQASERTAESDSARPSQWDGVGTTVAADTSPSGTGSTEEDARDIELLLRGQTDKPALTRGRSSAGFKLQSDVPQSGTASAQRIRSFTPATQMAVGQQVQSDQISAPTGHAGDTASMADTPHAVQAGGTGAVPLPSGVDSTLLPDEDVHRAYQQAWEDAQDRRDMPGEHTSLEQIDSGKASWVELDPSAGMGIGFRWSPRFAAGRIMPSSAVFSLLVQAFYNPSLLRLIRLFARGDSVHIRHLPVPAELLHVGTCTFAPRQDGGHPPQDSRRIRRSGTMDSQPGRMPPVFTGAPGGTPARHEQENAGRLCNCTIPYARLFLHMLLKVKVIPLGLFRERHWASSPLPYVHANPRMCAPVRAGDVMFVVVPFHD